jgi:ABC-type amino acid transport substrate-binding protein
MKAFLTKSIWLILALLPAAPAVLAADIIPLYVYYQDPLFAAGGPQSLTDKLAVWLTQRANGRYQFVPTQIPRRRLQLMIRQPHWHGVVAWANPRWFEETGQPRQNWSRPYMIDANMVASLRSAPVEYEDDQSLQGLRIGSVQGYHYKDSAELLRDDADSEARTLLKLRQRRVPVAFLQASSFPFFRQQFPDLDDWIHLSAKPRTIFERAFFTAPDQPELLAFLNQQVDALLADRPWQELMGTCKLVKPRLAAATDAQRKLCR